MSFRTYRRMVGRAVEPARARASEFGHRRGWEWLEYDPITMWRFHQVTVGDASPIAEALGQCFPDASSLIDVGAGTGAISAAWRRRGRQVVAYERSAVGRMMARLQGVEARRLSLEDEPPARVDSTFDLALCLEVAEHVPAALSRRLIEFLARVAPTVVFSAAPPGQGGHFHVNEQPASYWDALFEACSMREDTAQTAALQRALPECGCHQPFRIDHTRVFVTQPQRRAKR